MVAVLASCERDPIEQLDRPKDPVPDLAVAPPPSPPPPPPEPRPVAPPAEIASFLAEAAHATGPWHVTINELAGQAPNGRRFLGYRVKRVRAVAQPLADDLVARLALATSYVDGDVGCVGQPVGIAVARGRLAINFVEDCGHVYQTEQGHGAGGRCSRRR